MSTTTTTTTTTTTNLKVRALMFGLNYTNDQNGATLRGCHNDVINMAKYLENMYKIKADVYCDDGTGDGSTTAQGILTKLFDLCVASYRENLDLCWIHYSGHGSYIRDSSGDELDGRDECLVPTDYSSAGFINDDKLQTLFRNFNPKTRVVFVSDSCHSGTIVDLKFSWEVNKVSKIENSRSSIAAKVITLSGCMDNQTSADAYNVLNDGKFQGAMTSCLLITLNRSPNVITDVFMLLSSLRMTLRAQGFSQVPKLCSTYNLVSDKVFLPAATVRR